MDKEKTTEIPLSVLRMQYRAHVADLLNAKDVPAFIKAETFAEAKRKADDMAEAEFRADYEACQKQAKTKEKKEGTT